MAVRLKGFRQHKRKFHKNREPGTGGIPKSAASMGKTPASLYTHKVVVPFDGAGRKSWRRVPRTDVQISWTRNKTSFYEFGRVGLSNPDYSASL